MIQLVTIPAKKSKYRGSDLSIRTLVQRGHRRGRSYAAHLRILENPATSPSSRTSSIETADLKKPSIAPRVARENGKRTGRLPLGVASTLSASVVAIFQRRHTPGSEEADGRRTLLARATGRDSYTPLPRALQRNSSKTAQRSGFKPLAA